MVRNDPPGTIMSIGGALLFIGYFSRYLIWLSVSNFSVLRSDRIDWYVVKSSWPTAMQSTLN